MNGHQFVQRQFYQPIMCALCQEFLLTGEGYQCEDCRYACHKKCYPKIVTKCVSKSNLDGVSDQSIVSGPIILIRAGGRRGEDQSSHSTSSHSVHEYVGELVLSLWIYVAIRPEEFRQVFRWVHSAYFEVRRRKLILRRVCLDLSSDVLTLSPRFLRDDNGNGKSSAKEPARYQDHSGPQKVTYFRILLNIVSIHTSIVPATRSRTTKSASTTGFHTSGLATSAPRRSSGPRS